MKRWQMAMTCVLTVALLVAATGAAEAVSDVRVSGEDLPRAFGVLRPEGADERMGREYQPVQFRYPGEQQDRGSTSPQERPAVGDAPSCRPGV